MLSLLLLLGLFVLSIVVSSALGGLVLSPLQLPGVLLVISWAVTHTLALYVARGFTSRFPEWTLPLELAQATVRAIASNYGDNVSGYQNAATLRRQSEQIGDLLGSVAHTRNRTVLQPFELHGLEHLWVRSLTATAPDVPQPAHRVVVLYFHGGGYVTLSPRMYQPFASTLQTRLHRALCQQLGMSGASVQVDVLLANYRKGPEHRYPSAALDALAMYKFLLENEQLSPRQIIVMGDSAGGGLTMTTMLRLRDENPALLPLAGVLLCPFVDRETKGNERATPFCILADRLVEGFGDAYFRLEGPPSAWGDASPYHCDLRGLPPVHIQTGELDYILPHSMRLLQKAHETGLTDWTLEIVPNMPHAFTLYPQDIAPSVAKGIEAVAQYSAGQFAAAIKAKEIRGDVDSHGASLKKAPSF